MIALVAGSSIIFLMNRRPHPKSGQIETTSNGLSVTSTDKNSATSSQASQASSDKSSSAGVQANPSGDLAAPSGSFVSNHRPGQNGSDLLEASQCTTTPGAKCFIKFTQGDVVKTLPARGVETSGSVFWEWKINDAGLTEGKWSVTAIATLGSQTKSTTDQLTLEVQ